MYGIPWSDGSGKTGLSPLAKNEHVSHPIVFVHGNGRSASDWECYFDIGPDKRRLWAITFDNSEVSHQSWATQLDSFIESLYDHVSFDKISIVAHSLGVTVSRLWINQYNNGRFDVDTFVGIAGANDGTSLCAGMLAFPVLPEQLKPCRKLAPQKIASLKKEIGDHDNNVDYYTICGTRDRFFVAQPDSPKLDHATNIEVNEDHDGARTNCVDLVYNLISI